MKLTSTAKRHFEKWYVGDESVTFHRGMLVNFYKLRPSMQYGVYVDFFYNSFDSVSSLRLFGEIYYRELRLTAKSLDWVRGEIIEEANIQYNENEDL